jgi:hypothetical protein
MKPTFLLQFTALSVFGATALLGACSSDNDGPSGGAGTSNGGRASGGTSAAGASGGKGGQASAGMSEGGIAGEESVGGAGGEGRIVEGGGAGGETSRHFTVTLENVAPIRLFTSAGIFNTPVGDTSPGPATPGKMYQFTIDAGRKQKLSFATMLAATNDLFFGPDGAGIALYDPAGTPISGDVTSQIRLWDVGTEVNEEPGVGLNTVGKQGGPNTGTDEHGNVVDIVNATNGVHFDYPPVASVIQVTVTHTADTHFLVTIKDVSTTDTLMTSAGNRAAPLSPGVWVVHNAANPLFTVGMPDRGMGLEHIAEDGNPTALGAFVTANAGITYPASPGVWVVHSAGTKPLFTVEMPDYDKGIEGIAEDGNPANLGANLSTLNGALGGAIFNTPVGATSPGAITPGKKYQFSFDASPGDALSFATMLAATNDVFFGPKDTGIALFDGHGMPISGDISDQVSLWDTGSEGNEEPGIGPNTVTNQLAPNTGTAGEGKVQLLSAVNDGFAYPLASSVLEVNVIVE